jgi:hypothetical protein
MAEEGNWLTYLGLNYMDARPLAEAWGYRQAEDGTHIGPEREIEDVIWFQQYTDVLFRTLEQMPRAPELTDIEEKVVYIESDWFLGAPEVADDPFVSLAEDQYGLAQDTLTTFFDVDANRELFDRMLNPPNEELLPDREKQILRVARALDLFSRGYGLWKGDNALLNANNEWLHLRDVAAAAAAAPDAGFALRW